MYRKMENLNFRKVITIAILTFKFETFESKYKLLRYTWIKLSPAAIMQLVVCRVNGDKQETIYLKERSSS